MMHPAFTQCRAWILLLIPFLIAAPAAAQPSLEARMRAFSSTVERGTIDSIAAFFPRRGTWTWVVTTHAGALGDRVGMWRFDAAQTREVIDYGGPACQSFTTGGEIARVAIDEAREHPRPWRRVRGNRFVPRGAASASPLFVQWRREDGRWVVSSFGDKRWRRPRLLGREVDEGTRDSIPNPPLVEPIPEGGPHAGRARWYLEHRPILFDGHRFYKYGLPRTLAPGDVTRIGSLHGVGLYEETGAGMPVEVLYVPVGPGLEFQPYNGEGSSPCYDPAVRRGR